jgi:hypothetical protein
MVTLDEVEDFRTLDVLKWTQDQVDIFRAVSKTLANAL